MASLLSIALANTPAKAKRISGVSPQQSRIRQQFSGLIHMFKALPMAKKGKWQLAANEINASQSRTGRHKMTPVNAFSAINHARLLAQMPILEEPILPLNGPPVFPQITLTAANTSGAFALNILSPVPLGYPVCLQATPPVVAGKTTYAPSAFKPLGTLSGLAIGPNTIAALYMEKYGVPEAGAAIAVRLCAVSPAGLCSHSLVAAAVYQSAAAEDGSDSRDTRLRVA